MTLKSQNVFQFAEEDYIEALYVWILRGKQTYATLDDPDFRDFIHKLAPARVLPNRHTVALTVLEKIEATQQVIAKALKHALTVAMTFDMWTSRCGFGFGCLTAHFFGETARLRSVLLEYKDIPHPHDGEAICAFIEETLKNYRIEKKVVGITTDNASNNILAIDMLVDRLDLRANFSFGFLKFRCCAHILDLAVNKALAELRPLVSTIKTIVATIKCSPKRSRLFEAIQRDLGREKPLQLVEDVATRWNSTFAMLERAMLLKDAIEKAQLDMKELKFIRRVNWFQLADTVSFLGPFNELTEKLSADKTPTLPFVMAVYPKLLKHLRETEWEDEIIREAAAAFKVKLEEYEGFLDQPIPVMATVLDPRFKLSTIDPAGHIFAKDLLSLHIKDLDAEPVRATHTNSFLSNLFVQPSVDEVESYLSDPRANEKCDVSLYWKDYAASKWPKLSRLARSVLNIQATSVPCERANSRAALVDTPHRNRLDIEGLRANVLANSWISFQE